LNKHRNLKHSTEASKEKVACRDCKTEFADKSPFMVHRRRNTDTMWECAENSSQVNVLFLMTTVGGLILRIMTSQAVQEQETQIDNVTIVEQLLKT